MKYLLFTLSICCLLACKNEGSEQEQQKDPNLLDTELIKVDDDSNEIAEITFENDRWKFGQIQQDETVEHMFKFTNTGTNPLIISNASGSCGCTIPNWPKEPIAAGESGEISVKFSAGTRQGKQSKVVKILANTQPNETLLYVEGEILTP